MNKVLNSIVHKEPIHKGWSEDKKFCVTNADGTKYLLRLSQLAKYESKKKLFSMMEQIAALDITQKIHTIPIPKPEEEWDAHCNRRMDMLLKDYHLCGLKCDGDHYLVDYIEKNRYLLKNRPQCYLVGDYNVINMMYENGDLRIIDFERFDIGDPWVECDGIVWSAMASPHFTTGQLHGYFDGRTANGIF